MADQTTETLLQDLEVSLLHPSVRKSERVSELLADSFIEFGSSGRVFTKREVIAALRSESPVKLTATDFKVQLLAADVALVIYRATRHSDPAVHSIRSSVWRKSGQWQMVFHQGTVSMPAT